MEQAKRKQGERSESQAMTKVRKLMDGGMSVTDASLKCGVQRNSVYRRPWYKELFSVTAKKAGQ